MNETFDDLEKLGAEALLGDPTRAVLESPEAFVEAALSVLLDPEMRVEFRAHMRACDEITAIGLTVDRAQELADQVRDDGVIGLSPRDLADVFASRTVYDAVGAALAELDDDAGDWLDERGEGTDASGRDPWRSAWLDSVLATPSAVEILRFEPSPSWVDRWPRYALAALVVLAVLAATVLWQLQQPTPSTNAAERLPAVDSPLNVEPIPQPPAPRTAEDDDREALEALADGVVMLTDEGRCLEAGGELARLRAEAGETVMAEEITRLAKRVANCLDTIGPAPVPRRPVMRMGEPRAVETTGTQSACKLDDIDAAVERARVLLLRSPARAASRLEDVLACGEDPFVRAQLGFALERMGRPCDALPHYRRAHPELAGSLQRRVQQSLERWELGCE